MRPSKNKSRTFRRVQRRTPGGRTVKHHELRKPSKARCAGCGAVLKGVARERPYKMQNMPKSKKKPNRPYGGALCSRCTRAKIKEMARM